MANIAIRNEKPVEIAPVLDIPEPARMIRDFIRWNPFRETAPFAPDVSAFVPAFEVREADDRFVFIADLPGMKESELEVTIAGSRLVIAGERKPELFEENARYFAAERGYGAFQRSFTLPDGVDVDHIVADLDNGVLTLVVPKMPEM